MNLKDVQVLMIDDEEYARLVGLINKNDELPSINDDFAFAINIEGNPVIVLRDVIESFPPYVHKAVIAHELAHLHGIEDEEEADRWALRHLDDKRSKTFLVENWELRHGWEFNYDEFLMDDDYPIHLR